MTHPSFQLKTVRTPEQMLGVMAYDCSSHQDPWARHWIVLPGEGPAEWVRQRWAMRTGVSARSQVLNIRTLLESPLAGNPQARFSIEKCSLVIAAYLAARNGESQTFSRDLNQPAPCIDEKILSHAKTLAEAIDLGLLARSDPKDFAKSDLLKEIMEDPNIKLILNQHLAKVDNYKKHCKEWVSSWQKKGGLPQIWIGLDAGLPIVQWQRLMDMLSCCDASKINIYQLSPAEVYWGDLTLKRKNCDPNVQPGPLLKHFGKRLQDLHNQVLSSSLGDGDGGIEYEMPESSPSLLGRLQECCHHVAFPTSRPFDPTDHSFEVHSARSPLRELEVCRDRILQAMAEDSNLRPEEILVLLVDRDTYSPLVMSAFQPQLEAERWIPFSLSSHCLPNLNPFARALQRIFKALSGRVQRQELLDLLEDNYIAQQYHFESLGTELFKWLMDGNFSWGIDREHRKDEQEFDDARWSLQFVMERLALGAVCAPEDLTRVIYSSTVKDKTVSGELQEKRVPLERTAGLGTKNLAGLARLVKNLMGRHREWNMEKSRSIEAWNGLCINLIEEFIPKEKDQEMPEVILFKSGLEVLKHQLQSPIGLTSKAYLKLIKPLLENLSTRGASSGGVKIGSLQQDAGLPAKMICVLGLSADIFPRREDRPPWHPLAGASQLGDPDRREDDRHHLLLSLLSCSDRIVLSYLGGSDTDNRELPPSSPLSDFIGAARLCCELDPEQPAPFIFRHGLNGFSPQSHRSEAPVSGRSYSLWEQRECKALMEKSDENIPGLWTQPSKKTLAHAISRNDLKFLLKEAPRLFLNSLNVWLPSEEESMEEGEPLANNGLQKYTMKHQLLETRIQQKPESHLFELWKTNGLLPPRKIGDEVLADIINQVPLVSPDLCLKALRISGKIDFSEWGLQADLEVGTSLNWYRDDQGEAHHFSIRDISKNSREFEMLELMIDWLCLCWSEDIKLATIHVTKVKNNFKLHAPRREDIPQLLLNLVQLCQMARQIILPVWKETYNAMSEVIIKFKKDSEKKNSDPKTIANDPEAQAFDEKEKLKQTLEEQFQEVWEGGFGSFSPPGQRPLTRLVFRNCTDVVAWKGPRGFDLKPFQLDDHESLGIGVFRWLKEWENRLVEVIL
jgi:exonuclease V gamma subunit